MPAKIRTEFTVAVPNRAGILAELLDSLTKEGVNVLAFCGWGEDEKAQILFVPDNEEKTRRALSAGGFKAAEAGVVTATTASGKGAGAKLASQLSKAGINIDYVYATTAGDGPSMAVFGVRDAEAALEALK